MTKIINTGHKKYIYITYRLGLLRFSFYKLGTKLTIRFEVSKGWN